MQENPLNKTELVLFDLDGTLIDTAPDFLISLNNILLSNDKDLLRLDDIRNHISDGSGKLIKVGFNINEDHSEFKKLKTDLLEEYKINLTKNSCLFPGIKELLQYLTTNNISFGIVTNKPYEYAKPLIDSFNELSDSLILICPDHLNKPKPSPEGILLACNKIKVSPLNACYVGDHNVDIAAGIAAGMMVISCEYGYGELPKDISYGEIRIDHPKKLVKYLSK